MPNDISNCNDANSKYMLITKDGIKIWKESKQELKV
jgi:hypothetical protein